MRTLTSPRPFSKQATVQQTAPALQMYRLLQLRWTEIAGQCLAILAAVFGLGLPLPLEGLFSVCLMLAAFNLFSHWRLVQSWPVTAAEVFAQICLDVLALWLLLYLSGGSSNPFSSLLLVPLTITATLLPLGWVWAMAALTAAVYSALLLWHHPLPIPTSPLEGLNDFICTVTGLDRSLLSHDNGFSLHVVGMWINFLLSALIVTVFITRLATVLRARDRALARARENTLRHEQVLALGTLAAGAAHQLGTPLSTMAVVIHDLQLEQKDNPALKDDLALLRSQVDLCKGILATMVASAQRSDDGVKQEIRLDRLLQRVLEQWQLLQPKAPVAVSAEGVGEGMIADDPALEQALLNLLNNAADACAEGLELKAEIVTNTAPDQCRINILDRGPGLDVAIAQRLGEPFISSKGQAGGMGIGFFLSNATLERLGGRVEIFNRDTGGACTRITLPCRRLP